MQYIKAHLRLAVIEGSSSGPQKTDHRKLAIIFDVKRSTASCAAPHRGPCQLAIFLDALH
jgi:hypothetical protein